MKGKFITLEGSEGSGKSTQARFLCDYLKKQGLDVLFIREPGGVKISESIRKILLDVKNEGMSDECETLLYMAARSQLAKDVISPAIEKGQIVISDRFLDSTRAYQGFGNGVDMDFINTVGEFATLGIEPDLTLLFDIDTKKGLTRTSRVKDRIETRNLTYHNRVRKGYLQLAKEAPRRIKVINVDKGKEEIHAIVKEYVDELLEKTSK